MSESRLGDLGDQEVFGLFQQHLPIQPLPNELSSRLYDQVMAEVTLHLHKRTSLTVLPWLTVLHRLLGTSFHRR
jgi:hypothetical protein